MPSTEAGSHYKPDNQLTVLGMASIREGTVIFCQEKRPCCSKSTIISTSPTTIEPQQLALAFAKSMTVIIVERDYDIPGL